MTFSHQNSKFVVKTLMSNSYIYLELFTTHKNEKREANNYKITLLFNDINNFNSDLLIKKFLSLYKKDA